MNYVPFIVIVTALIAIIVYGCMYISKMKRSIQDFAEAIRCHDFSKHYPEKKGRRKHLYHYFNTINNTFLNLNKEMETQHHYLKQILELVDTGILAYDIESLDVLWMNNSLKNMFKLPALKNLHWLEKREPSLFDELKNTPLGENRLMDISSGKQIIKILINASSFQTENKTYKLIAFHNIGATLEDVEAGAWKGLLSVMTHEIMNSISPVASLADTMKKRMEILKSESTTALSSDFEDIELAMETIRRRSDGLLKFAETYRNLSQTIVPQMKQANLYEIISSVYQLMQPSLKAKGILFEIQSDYPETVVLLDRDLIEQVLINFITNAMYVVRQTEDPHVILFSGRTPDGHSYITVADNGCGIPKELRDKIFIPFFSTKKNGSGIGLSLSREIVKLHKGTLQVQSQEGEGSAFSIVF